MPRGQVSRVFAAPVRRRQVIQMSVVVDQRAGVSLHSNYSAPLLQQAEVDLCLSAQAYGMPQLEGRE